MVSYSKTGWWQLLITVHITHTPHLHTHTHSLSHRCHTAKAILPSWATKLLKELWRYKTINLSFFPSPPLSFVSLLLLHMPLLLPPFVLRELWIAGNSLAHSVLWMSCEIVRSFLSYSLLTVLLPMYCVVCVCDGAAGFCLWSSLQWKIQHRYKLYMDTLQ